VRRAILKALPNGQEGLAYQMPAYTLNRRRRAVFRRVEVTLLALSRERWRLVGGVRQELAPLRTQQGTLKFPYVRACARPPDRADCEVPGRQLTTRDAATAGAKADGKDSRSDPPRICAALPAAYREDVARARPASSSSRARVLRDVFRAHRDDGRLSLWVPVADGLQPLMIEESPDIYFYPRMSGAGGWVGIPGSSRSRMTRSRATLREARRIIGVQGGSRAQAVRHVGSARRTEPTGWATCRNVGNFDGHLGYAPVS